MTNDTAILSIIKDPFSRQGSYLGMLTFETTTPGTSTEYLRYLPFFFTDSLTERMKDVTRAVGVLRQDFVEYAASGSGRSAPRRTLLDQLHKIGKRLYHDMELAAIWQVLFPLQSIKNLVIYTNDTSVPWQWVFNDAKKEFLCERFAMGKIFAQHVNESSSEIFRTSTAPQESATSSLPKDYLANAAALILHGNFVAASSPTGAKHEVAEMSKTFKGRIGTVEPFHESSEFFAAMSRRAKDIKIIHYAGHSNSQELLLSPRTKITPRLLRSQHVQLTSAPVVFLNGCSTGRLAQVWQKDASMAAAFLSIGSAACIVTCLPVLDSTATRFAASFYRELLDRADAISIGEALRQVRNEQKKDRDHENDLTRLFFDLFGDPRFRLIAPRHQTIKASMIDKFERDEIYSRLRDFNMSGKPRRKPRGSS
jgi:hypothetical protein